MKTLFWLAAMAASALAAPEAHIHLDLSGDWTRLEPGAAPRPFGLPTTTIEATATDQPFRLERRITLPAEGLRGLALLMTPLSRPYAVRINGVSIGGHGTPGSWWSPSHEAAVLGVPEGILHAGENQIEIDVSQSRVFFRGQGRLPAGGPLLGEESVLRQLADGRRRARQLRFVYLPVNCGLQLLFAAILWAMSRGSRYGRPLRLMALYFLLQVVAFDAILTLEYFAEASPSLWDFLLPVATVWATALLTETGLALAGLAVPWPARAGYYLLTGVLTSLGGYYSLPRLWIPIAVDAWLLAKVWRAPQSLPWQYLALLLGYDLVQAALRPPFNLPPLLTLGPLGMHVVPGYRIFIGLLFILFVARQSARDRNERERLAGELEAARAMQQLLLPKAEVPGIEAVYRPAAEVGGDFYFAEPTADGGVLVAVGDVSGKGLKAAMLVSMVLGALRRQATGSPARVLAGVNEALVGYTGGGFVTCCCAWFPAGGGGAVIANAGHLAPYADGREVETHPGLPLGLAPGASYAETTVSGERFLFLSDGVVEAENPRRELFGFDRTREISGRSAQEIAEAAWQWGQNDDITVVTVRTT